MKRPTEIGRNIGPKSDLESDYYQKGPTGVRLLKNARLSIKVSQEYRDNIEEKAKNKGMSMSAFIRYSLDNVGPESDLVGPKSDQSPTFLMEQIVEKDKQIATKDEQIANLQKSTEGLQQSLDQAQQLHAMSEQRHQAELAKIEGRGFIQRLKAVFS